MKRSERTLRFIIPKSYLSVLFCPEGIKTLESFRIFLYASECSFLGVSICCSGFGSDFFSSQPMEKEMKESTIIKLIIFLFIITSLILITNDADAANRAILDSVKDKYISAASTWGAKMVEYATNLFFVLMAISLVWTFVPLLFRSANVNDALIEIIRFCVFCGFFLWLLQNGPQMASSIIDSMVQIGEKASGQGQITPSTIMDKGYDIYTATAKAADELDWTEIATALMYRVLGCLIYVLFGIIAINMLLQYCSCWILAYAGIFFLGFGSTRWTSDIAINYFKSVLGTGTQLMVMILLVGIGQKIIDENIKVAETPEEIELIIILLFSLSLLMLVAKLPPLVAGIITGGSIGGGGIGAFGAGAAVGAASTAASVAATTGRGAMHVGKSVSVGRDRSAQLKAEGAGFSERTAKGALATAGYLARAATGFHGGASGGSGSSSSKDSNDSGGGEKDSGGNNDGKSGGAQDQNKKTSDLAKHAAQAAQANFKSQNASSSGAQSASPQASSVAADTVMASAMGATQATGSASTEAATPGAQTSMQGVSPQSAQHVETNATGTTSQTASTASLGNAQTGATQATAQTSTKAATPGVQATSQSASTASTGNTQASNPLGSPTLQSRHIPEANYAHDAAAQARAAQAAQNIASRASSSSTLSRNQANVSPTIQHIADRKVSTESIGQIFKRPDKRG